MESEIHADSTKSLLRNFTYTVAVPLVVPRVQLFLSALNASHWPPLAQPAVLVIYISVALSAERSIQASAEFVMSAPDASEMLALLTSGDSSVSSKIGGTPLGSSLITKNA